MPDFILEGIKGTETEKNLYYALGGESQAHLKYKIYAKKAKEEGFVEIQKLFDTISDNEKAHAEIWFRYLGGAGSTAQNLDASAGGEHFEWSSMYKQFAQTARSEGFPALAELFDKVGAIENEHEQKFRSCLQKLYDGSMFRGSGAETKWICLNCGHIHTGAEPPRLCPVCSHPEGYFKELS